MKTFRTLFSIILLFTIIVLATRPVSATPQVSVAEQQSPAAPAASPQTCHFGVAVVDPFTSYDLSTMGIGSYIDFGNNRNSSVPANIDYFRVLYIGANFASDKAYLPAWLEKYPGSTWILGNEPDSEVTYQDHLAADVYAQRFFVLATIVRQLDPTAKIGFGAIIQATPVRLYYLTLAMNKLVQLAGSAAKAHALIDFYPIHAYNLNEGTPLYNQNGKMITWGAGVPTGYNAATWPAPELIHPEWGETYKTYDINIFKTRVIAFRQWMKDQGEQDKPMWITEYGSLFPPEGNPYLYASDNDSGNYMVQTYDFMLGYKDPSIGYASDDYRLVQKWTWYSLNDARTHFGGALYNSVTQRLTPVGEMFFAYNPSTTAVPVTDPDVYVVPGSLVLSPMSPSTAYPGRVNYKITVKVSNNISSDRQISGKVDLYDGATLVGSMQTMLPRCSGTVTISYLMKNLTPGVTHSFTATVSVLPGSGTDTNLGNNTLAFTPTALPVPTSYPRPSAYFPIAMK
jgi:hypothetical protein